MNSKKEFEMELTFERSFLTVRSSNIKMIAYVDEKIDEKQFCNAVRKLAMKHPYLRSRIIMRDDRTAYFTTAGGKEPNTIIVDDHSEDDVFKAVYQEDLQPAHWETDPTSRFFL